MDSREGGSRTHCMRYDSAAREFVYDWRLHSAQAGRVTLRAQLSFLQVASASEQIMLVNHAH